MINSHFKFTIKKIFKIKKGCMFRQGSQEDNYYHKTCKHRFKIGVIASLAFSVVSPSFLSQQHFHL